MTRSVADVAGSQLCTGCGACAAMHPEAIEMVDTLDHCRRPRARVGVTVNGEMVDALRVCPGVHLAHGPAGADAGEVGSLRGGWGPVRRVWEGYAADDGVRLAGSSGGAATALSLYCLERGGMHGVLHTAAREDVPYLNGTVMSRTREDLLARTGSRYAPSSPCDGLGEVEAAAGPCVFIGKPCDAAAVQKMRRIRPELDGKLGVTIAFFCAGTPSTRGTLDLLRKVGVEDPAAITSLRYRGNGWPGMWKVRWAAPGGEREASLTYAESWGFLQKYRQWRCYICPDHTGEFADIAVGDPWYRAVEPGEPGKSLIVARTPRGEEIVRAAAAAGYLVLEREDADLLPRSQPNLLKTRASLWGRLLALRLTGAAAPRYRGMSLLRSWVGELSLREKAQSVYGTLKRVRTRRLRERAPVLPLREEPAAAGRELVEA